MCLICLCLFYFKVKKTAAPVAFWKGQELKGSSTTLTVVLSSVQYSLACSLVPTPAPLKAQGVIHLMWTHTGSGGKTTIKAEHTLTKQTKQAPSPSPVHQATPVFPPVQNQAHHFIHSWGTKTKSCSSNLLCLSYGPLVHFSDNNNVPCYVLIFTFVTEEHLYTVFLLSCTFLIFNLPSQHFRSKGF